MLDFLAACKEAGLTNNRIAAGRDGSTDVYFFRGGIIQEKPRLYICAECYSEEIIVVSGDRLTGRLDVLTFLSAKDAVDWISREISLDFG